MSTNPPPKPLPTTDILATLAGKTIQDAFAVGEVALKAYLITIQPWLNLPGVSIIFSALLNFFFSNLGDVFGDMAEYIVMDIQEVTSLQSAAKALAALQAAQQSGDANAIAQANQNMDAAVASVLHYIGDTRG